MNWWTPVGPEGGWISDLVVDPQTRTVYATTGGGVFASTSGGASWERRHRGVHGSVSRLAVSSRPASVIYTAGSDAVYRSTDGGLSWTAGEEELFGGGISSLIADPADSSVVYAGTPYNGVLKSSDGGASWTQVFVDVDGSCGPIHSLAIDRRTPSTVYAACGYNRAAPFVRSTDGGATWMPAAPLPQGGDFLFLVLGSGTPGVVYVTVSGEEDGHYGLFTYRSTDDGASWTRFGLPDAYMLPGPPGVLFMGKFRSTDGGATWQELTLPSAPSALAYAPDDPATLYAGTAPPPIAGAAIPSGLYKSTDAGATWREVNRGLFTTSIRTLEITPQSALHTVALPTGLLKRARNANRWQQAGAGLPGEAFGDVAPLWSRPLAIDPQTPANLYLGTRDGLFRSSNGGAAWTLVNQCAGISYLLIDPRDPDRLFALGHSRRVCPEPTGSCSVFQSDDAGASWSCISQPGFSRDADGLVLDPSQPSRLYVLRRNKNNIWTTPDRGRTWGKLKLPRHQINLTTLTVDPRDSRRLYLGTSDGRVYKTANRGSSWTEISKGLPVGFYEQIWQIVVDPQRPQTLYAAHTSGVYISGNGGSTWHPLNGGLPDAPWLLALDPRNPRKLYAGTRGNGLYVHERR